MQEFTISTWWIIKDARHHLYKVRTALTFKAIKDIATNKDDDCEYVTASTQIQNNKI